MKANIAITYRDKDNNIIENPVEGQIAQSPETQQLYTYKDGDWELIQATTGLNMSMYDMNKQIIAQLPRLSLEDELKGRDTIQKYLNSQDNKYYMLLCRDINYYTVFVVNKEPIDGCAAVDEIYACADYIGNVKSIEKQNGGIEIWVHPREEGQDPVAMYLFAYDGGVIECIL